MIHIDFDPSKLTGELKTWWEGWQPDADSARDELILKWETSGKLSKDDFDNEIWKKLKEFLLKNVFHGKCAYCETDIGMARQSGDAEHFRPKGRVNYKDGGKFVIVKVQSPTGQEITHPGYFWLAYNWKNLVPACRKCNSEQGKKNQFPIDAQHVLLRQLAPAQLQGLKVTPHQSPSWPGFYYLEPEDLDDAEDRLLLHPYYDDPRKYLQFAEHGIEAPVPDASNQPSRKGEHSIEVYELYNDDLRRARDVAQRSACTSFFMAYMNAVDCKKGKEECLKEAWNRISGVVEGHAQYSAAALDFVRLHCRTLGLY
jgi:5-methylcytosine-specific restriction endonuclease McrA